MAGTGSVLMIYGLAQGKFNCDHIFNLLCSYGNVLKVKILLNKPGTAMAHLDNPQGAKNAIHHLHGHQLMGSTLELNYSRHSYIADYSQGGTLADGSPCWKDFSQSRNNRFLTPESTSKNRIVAPAKVLHYYNGPPDSTDETLRELFEKVGASAPDGIKFFTQALSAATTVVAGPACKSATGLMEWTDVDLALEAFVLGNHHTLFAKNGQAYTFKMAFSSNTSLEHNTGVGSGGGGVINA
jgi:heterogeneous nuclear ribonucleoprotein L